MRTKVAIVANTPESFRYLLRAQLDRLREEGFDVHCVSGRGSYVSVLRRDGFVVHEVELTRLVRPAADIRAVVTMVRLFRQERFALAHTHTPKAAILGQLAARIAGTPHVVNTIHGLLAHDATPLVRRLVLEPLDRLTCGLSTAVLSQSVEDVACATRRHICARDKIRHLGQGIDLAQFDPSRFSPQCRLAIRGALGIAPDALIVAMVARFTLEKGYSEFFAMAREIARHRSDVHFMVIGTTLDERAPIERRPEHLGLEGRLTVLADRTDMPDLLSIADVVVLPTYREGFPRSLVEAAAMGIPVISTQIRGCREAVADGETGILVPPRDTNALVEAANALLEDDERRRRMGEQARRRARAEFDERRICDRVVALYRDLLGGDGNRRAIELPISRHRGAIVTRSSRGATAKRLFDVAAALILLVVTSPVLALAAIAIRATMGSPVLFHQRRVGRNGKIFTLFKLRTMASCPTGCVPETDDVRLTMLGRRLRGMSLDELPQLLNVVRGDMSLVGPRPLLPEYLGRYSPQQARRHAVRPGITGLAQVSGRNALAWEDKFKLDVWYVDHRTFRLDLWILCRTLVSVLSRNGIAADGHATMPEFLGNATAAATVRAMAEQRGAGIDDDAAGEHRCATL